MKSFLILLLAVPLAADELPLLEREFLSPVYTIDRKYRSMEGPGSLQEVYLGDTQSPELLWLIGVRTEIVGADGKTPQLPELMCHVNIDVDGPRHKALFGVQRLVGDRVVTLSQGILATRLPAGFGFPLASTEPLTLFTQVLNHNIQNPGKLRVRHRVTFTYVRDRDLSTPMKALFPLGVSGTVLLEQTRLSAPRAQATDNHGQSCLIAQRAPNAIQTGSDYLDPQGRKLTGHWVVPPGRQVNHSDVTWFMSLPYDTRLHYAAVHLHPFAESLALRDVTADKTIFTARAVNPRGKVGLEKVDTFLSREGIALLHDHQYELVSVYNNNTAENHDSMASVFLGLEDREFIKPTPEQLLKRGAMYEAQATSSKSASPSM